MARSVFAEAAMRLIRTVAIVLLTGGLVSWATGHPIGNWFGATTDDLANCPKLHEGMHDPIGGMDCVRILQRALKEEYPDQTVNGVFGPQTAANVRKFQQAQGLDMDGTVGRLTRTALAARQGISLMGLMPDADYAHSHCTGTACSVYLPRSVTGQLGGMLERHPWSSSIGLNTVGFKICSAIKRAGLAELACAVVIGGVTDVVANELKRAARKGHCLKVSIGLQDRKGWRLVDATPYNGRRCVN